METATERFWKGVAIWSRPLEALSAATWGPGLAIAWGNVAGAVGYLSVPLAIVAAVAALARR